MARPPVILNYHGIATVESRHDPVRLFVSGDRFRQQVTRLIKRGYRFVKMAEFARAMHGGENLEGLCALTFDDGSDDNHSVLMPILEDLGVPATIYVCPGLLGEPYPWLSPEAGVRFVDREELLSLASQPLIEIGSHTVEHTRLDSATSEEAYAEMSRSKQQLEDMLGFEVPSFCYPGCGYSPACPEAAERAGHTSAVTCGPRGGWTPYELCRESLHRTDGPLTFALKARGSYYRIREYPIVRVVRWTTRPIRHRH